MENGRVSAIRMLRWLSRRSDRRRDAQTLYAAIVTQTRQPTFYVDYEVPDTLEGRFELLVLHIFLVLERLRAEGSAGDAVAQELVDAFVSDMDTTMREVGVGDLSVPKKMRRMSAGFYERLQSYRRALAQSEPDAFAAVVNGFVYAEAEASTSASVRLASYITSSAEVLRERSLQDLFDGRLGLDTREAGSTEGAGPGH